LGIKIRKEEKEMKEIILSVLREVACDNTGTCQINLQAEGAREMIALALEKELQVYVMNLVEDIVTPQRAYKHPKID
jgi:hypothetical protein